MLSFYCHFTYHQFLLFDQKHLENDKLNLPRIYFLIFDTCILSVCIVVVN